MGCAFNPEASLALEHMLGLQTCGTIPLHRDEPKREESLLGMEAEKNQRLFQPRLVVTRRWNGFGCLEAIAKGSHFMIFFIIIAHISLNIKNVKSKNGVPANARNSDDER